jgi:hypothetical protein
MKSQVVYDALRSAVRVKFSVAGFSVLDSAPQANSHTAHIVAKSAADRWAARPMPLLSGIAIVTAFAWGTLLAYGLEWHLLVCIF